MSFRFALEVEYDGTHASGWQVQPGEPTIQGALEEALGGLCGHKVHVAGAGRTDAGVHALGQIAAFSTHASRTERAIRDGLNGTLPDFVSCIRAWRVADEFDPRRWSHGKHYRYRWLERRARSPLRAHMAWHHRGPQLAVDQMQSAAEHLEGTYDLSCFRASGCSATSTVRTIDSAAVRRVGDEVVLDIVGHGFLRHTVRIMAGTLLDVGLGRRDADQFPALIASKNRELAGRTAPAHGLTLVSVRLGDGPRRYTPEG